MRGRAAGYSKYETFPIWNLPLKHPVNIAYEAATVDLKDVNMIDSFHLERYGEVTVNYNRDIESFPLLRRIIEKITGEASVYQSPTDMGVNRAGFGIIDDAVIREASLQEIVRRYFKTGCDYKKGLTDYETFQRAKLIMDDLGLKESDRCGLTAAREYAARIREQQDRTDVCPVMAMELDDGTTITGKGSPTMDAAAAAVINAIKHLAGISDELHLISPVILEPIIRLKRDTFHSKVTALNCEEILIALGICAATNPMAAAAMAQLGQLKGSQAHATTILGSSDEQTFRRLGIDVTSDPEYPTENLYYNG